MNYNWKTLHSEMQQLISTALQSPKPETEQVSDAFRISLNFWKKMKEELCHEDFLTLSDEVYLYRVVKPAFTSCIEYFKMLYQGLTWAPEAKADALDFWEREARKLQRFREQNKEFVDYYSNGYTTRDREFFLPCYDELDANELSRRIYDADGQYISSRDALVAQFLAHQRYNEFVQKKIRAITG